MQLPGWPSAWPTVDIPWALRAPTGPSGRWQSCCVPPTPGWALLLTYLFLNKPMRNPVWSPGPRCRRGLVAQLRKSPGSHSQGAAKWGHKPGCAGPSFLCSTLPAVQRPHSSLQNVWGQRGLYYKERSSLHPCPEFLNLEKYALNPIVSDEIRAVSPRPV